MYSFRRLALLLALGLPAFPAVQAQSWSSSITPDPQAQADAQQAPAQQPQQPPAQAQQPPQSAAQQQQQMSVQARIKARREQRRVAAMHEVYSHLYEAYASMGYIRFTPGPSRQRATMYAWDTGFTRYFNERLGVTLDGRGYYGTAYVGLNQYNITRPAISEYNAMIGPTYRFYRDPKYSVSGRVLGGYAQGNFSGDTSGFGSVALGLYPDARTFVVTASAAGEYNLTPSVGLRLAPEYYVTGFGSTLQNSFGFTGGIVYRFGRQ